MPSTPSPARPSILTHTRESLPARFVEPLARLKLARHVERFPDDPAPRLAQLMREIKAPPPAGFDPRYLLAESAGRLLGFDEAGVDHEDNPQVLWLETYVAPALRRQGIGRQLVAAALEALSHHPIRQVGFSLLSHDDNNKALRERVESDWGMKPAIVGRKSRLYLADLDAAAIAASTEARMARIEPEYRALFFELDDLPPAETGFDLVDYCDMVQEIENLMPLEELVLEPERYTPERFRSWIDFFKGSGLTAWNYVVVEAATGRCVGVSNVSFDPEDPRRISQWDTGVRKSAQGRGLGKALKLLMLRKILAELPEAVFIHTDNAASNAAMWAINEALGFREHHRSLCYQIPLGLLCQQLGIPEPESPDA